MQLSLFTLLALSVMISLSSQNSCPNFPASFLAVAEQKINNPNAFIELDPELTFLKEDLKLREDAIQHTTDDAIKFFNESYGLDFTLSPPNENNEYTYENAILRPFRFADDINYVVITNNWIQTGSTRSNCYRINDGGFQVVFLAEQTLHGSYGGTSGRNIGVNEILVYGFYLIDLCRQSPVLIQYESAAPARIEPVDGTGIINCALYSRVLGRGQARGVFTVMPDPENPGQFDFFVRNSFTFYSD